MSTIVHERTEEQVEIDAEILERVKKGIEFLEETAGPNWVDLIDLKTLDLKSGDSCVCGQVFAEYTDEIYQENGFAIYKYENGYDYAEYQLRDGQRVLDLGFCAKGLEDWEPLQKTWEHVLTPMVSKGE